MNRNIMDDRIDRELRRRQLATRLITHQARTQTIEELTGLTRHQLATLRRRGGVPKDSRFRGPAPTSFEVFFTSARARSEGAVLALLYCALGAAKIPKRNGASDAAVERGERLCDVYEIWHHLFPDSPIEFEQLRLLGEGITRGEQVTFGYCGNCRAIILVDLLAGQRRICGYCARSRREDVATANSLTGREYEEIDLSLYGLQLLGGQLLRERKGGYTLEDGASNFG